MDNRVQSSEAWDVESLSSYASGKLDVGDLLIALAGGAAEAKLVGGASDMLKQGMWGDFQNIGYAITKGPEKAGDTNADKQLVHAIIGAALARAGTFVDAQVAAIRATASELVIKRSLTFDEVLAISVMRAQNHSEHRSQQRVEARAHYLLREPV